MKYPTLRERGFSPEAFDEVIVEPLIEIISSRSLTFKLLRNVWRTVGKWSRTNVLAWAFDDWFFGGSLLQDLPQEVRFTFNAANATTGVRFGFERDVIGDYVLGWASTAGSGLRVADAAAASAAVPGFFAPFTIDKVAFPCQGRLKVKLLDGGAYDNMGLEVVDSLRRSPEGAGSDPLLVALNAGGILRTGAYGWVPVIRDLARANSLLYRQSTALRMKSMVERFRSWEQTRSNDAPPFARRGVLFGLATRFPKVNPAWSEGRPEHPWHKAGDPDPTIALASVKTSFARFDRELCQRLIHRGWWLTGAALSTYHPELLGDDSLPVWRPL